MCCMSNGIRVRRGRTGRGWGPPQESWSCLCAVPCAGAQPSRNGPLINLYAALEYRRRASTSANSTALIIAGSRKVMQFESWEGVDAGVGAHASTPRMLVFRGGKEMRG